STPISVQVKDLTATAADPRGARASDSGSDLGADLAWRLLESGPARRQRWPPQTVGKGARSWSADFQTLCNPLLISSRIAGVMWLYTPRMPGTSWPIRSDCKT